MSDSRIASFAGSISEHCLTPQRIALTSDYAPSYTIVALISSNHGFWSPLLYSSVLHPPNSVLRSHTAAVAVLLDPRTNPEYLGPYWWLNSRIPGPEPVNRPHVRKWALVRCGSLGSTVVALDVLLGLLHGSWFR